ncbi:hypothetical protein ASPWEDRAFT_185805 [Aspergillus wentii DTO 134E9]|uniref:Fungal-type protein kinase domain-containing protein n=1 Tax=Aspergillus wentii DTO 134E9 TaxID=1073089 RepID=A0A1L9RES2_ASPWE|nr:uncharacterized protein ASPWEDRAFT_185805 [Aspergillus wentii DTO 134E9]OJJ33426.1 hypothetical protein ASPWEDRAFT_185805 [Aspergillus wentii DTO 134E9]
MAARNNLNKRDSMNKQSLHTSGSHWDMVHLDALHAYRDDNISLDRFFSDENSQFLPSDNDPVYQALRAEIIQPTEHDLRIWELSQPRFAGNPFEDFFDSLASAMTTGPASGQSGDSGSGSSGQEEDEIHSEDALKELVRVVLRREGGRLNGTWSLAMNRAHLSTPLLVGTTHEPRHAINDGGITLARSGHGGHIHLGHRPIVSFEAKKRNPAGRHYPTDQSEPAVSAIRGQEFSELLGQAFVCSERVDNKWQDHDGWLISIHGTRFRLVNAFFSGSYLGQVNSPILRENQRAFVWGTRHYNLKSPIDRCQAIKAVIGLIRFLKLGDVSNHRLRTARG